MECIYIMEWHNLALCSGATLEASIDWMKFWRCSKIYHNASHSYGVASSQPSGYSQAYPSTQQYPGSYTSQAGATPSVPASSAQPGPPPAGPRPQMRWEIWSVTNDGDSSFIKHTQKEATSSLNREEPGKLTG